MFGAALRLFVVCSVVAGAQVMAQRVELFVFEPSLQRLVGYGVLNGAAFELRLNDYEGPVTILWVREGKPPIAYAGTLANGGRSLEVNLGAQKVGAQEFLSGRGVTAKVQVTHTPGAPSAAPNASRGTGSAGGNGNANNNASWPIAKICVVSRP